MILHPTWLDDKETYRFFREGYKKIPKIPPPIGRVKPYTLNPGLARIEERRKRINSLASLYGHHYAQKLLYFHLSLDRFLRLEMPINRISYLLNETFFYFERYLYVQLDWEEGKPGFYRDHSLHAANEAYLGYKLLRKVEHLEPKFIDFLTQNNDITRYINNNCRVGLSDKVLKHIIYRTWFLSALFHDLGYVLRFNKKVREKMLSFHRHSDLIFRANRSSFDDIQMLLGNSLLFNTVKHEDLESCYNRNNHGTLSSFLMLSTFYSTPAFEGVDTLDRVAIELAARSIYFHDFPEEENKSPIEKGGNESQPEEKSSSPSKIPFGGYSKYFRKISSGETGELIPGEIQEFFNQKRMERINDFKIELPGDEKQTSIRTPFHIDPFAFYLRFIDEMHVFGRNLLSFDFNIDTGKIFEESPSSYKMPLVRNIVRFPAQVLECNVDKILRIYYIVDASLYYEKKGRKKNPRYHHSIKRLDETWFKYFLEELYWLKKSAIDSKIFKDLEFFFIEIWPEDEI